MDGLTIGSILASILANLAQILGDRGRSAFLKRLQQGQLPANHDLQKALKRSFLSAQQNIALECRQELIESFPRDYRGQAFYPAEHKSDLQWLNNKIKRIAVELKQVEKSQFVNIPVESINEIEVLLKPEGQLTEQVKVKFIHKLETEALKDADIAIYSQKIKMCLFDRVSDYFSTEIKYNQAIANIFVADDLAQIRADIADIKQQGSQGTPPKQQSSSVSKVLEIQKTAEGTLTLKIPIDDLEPERILEIVKLLQKL